jgi:hypothetical protein
MLPTIFWMRLILFSSRFREESGGGGGGIVPRSQNFYAQLSMGTFEFDLGGYTHIL